MIIHMANIITFLRIPLAVAMLFATPFSVAFWGIYLSCGCTDIVDGPIARMMHKESSLKYQFGLGYAFWVLR